MGWGFLDIPIPRQLNLDKGSDVYMMAATGKTQRQTGRDNIRRQCVLMYEKP